MRKVTDLSGREQYCVFDTPIGSCAVAWSERGVTSLQLPESDPTATEKRLLDRRTSPCAAEPSPKIKQVIAQIKRYLGGVEIDFSSVFLDLVGVAPFHQKVYEACAFRELGADGELRRPGPARRIPRGRSCRGAGPRAKPSRDHHPLPSDPGQRQQDWGVLRVPRSAR